MCKQDICNIYRVNDITKGLEVCVKWLPALALCCFKIVFFCRMGHFLEKLFSKLFIFTCLDSGKSEKLFILISLPVLLTKIDSYHTSKSGCRPR